MNMKKSMIALAVAGAFVSSAAMADATVYGVMHGSIDMANDGATTNATKTNQANSRQSRLGFKGSDDLGGGLSALWQVEGYITLDAGTGALANRNTFLGLKSDSMGTVLVGRNDTPYKTSTRKLDVFADTAADNRVGPDNTTTDTRGMGAGHDIRVSNILVYTSPDMSGLSVAAAVVFGAEGTPTVATANKKGSALSLAGMYTMDQIYATLAYQTAKAGDAGTGDLATDGTIFTPYPGTPVVDDKANAFKLGGGYTTDAFAVNAVLERLTYKPAAGGTDIKNTNIYLAGKFNVSSTDAVKLAWTKLGDTKAATTTTDGAKQISVGYDHGMSKNTTVYALYTKTTDDTVHTTGTTGYDPSVISLGMKVAF